MAKVVLEHVTKSYDEFHAVDNVNLVIEDGSFVVLVGPSGCGKSTTLRMVAGLETPTEGRIYIDGKDVTDLEPRDRNIAMVFQSYALYPHMTVFDNMAFALRAGYFVEGKRKKRYPKQEIEKRVNDAAELLGISDQLDKKPKQLSGGQRQRVALGRSLVRNPTVFLMDEPLSNLDAKLRTKMRLELKRLHKKLGATIIYVTHDQMEAMTLADRIAIIDKGILKQYAPPLSTYNKPADSFVASFIGSPAMNIIPGSLTPHSQGYFFEFERQKFDLPVNVAKAVYKAKLSSTEASYGIRPENVIVISGTGEAPEVSIPGTVFGLEALGSKDYVFIRTGDTEICAEVDADLGFAIGDPCQIKLASEKGHVFDNVGRAVY